MNSSPAYEIEPQELERLLEHATEAERLELMQALRLSRGGELDESTGYDAHKRRMTAASRARSTQGRDIGRLPAIESQARRDEASADLRRFCELYLPARFCLEWSGDHLTAIARIEQSIRTGGLFALAMPRGSGKTTLCEAAAMWAHLTGKRRYVLLIGATATASKKLLVSIKTELETNDLLMADFPEVCYPIRCLEGLANRAKGQTYLGVPTRIQWGSDAIIAADIPGSRAAQSIIDVASITGQVRGRKHQLEDGSTARPDFVIPDDPQTDKSARSKLDTDNRIAIINGAVLGLAGPGKRITGVMPCTVIRRGDLADTALDRTKSPHWHGERFQMMKTLPTNGKLWDEYAEIRRAELANGGDGQEANEFYAANREAMDAGAVPSWPARYESHELSAIQSAMNIKIDRPAAFAAEYQNEPLDVAADIGLLSSDQITRKQSPHPRGEMSPNSNYVTAFIDVQEDALFWMVCGWSATFTGQILDYGVFPHFTRSHFRLSDLRGLLAAAYPGLGLEARWYRGIVDLASLIVAKEWVSANGASYQCGKLLVDAGYGNSTDTVHEAVRACRSSVVQASKGKYYGASSVPMGEFTTKPGRRVGVHWFEDRIEARGLRAVTIDTNWWKSFVQARLSTPIGDPGALTLFQTEPFRHELLASHLTAEYRVRVENKGTGKEVDEWKLRPERPDNHWLDCLVGCAVGASILGASIQGGATSQSQPKRLSFAEMQQAARQRRA